MAELLYAEDATSPGAWRAVGLGALAVVLLGLLVADGGLVSRLVGGGLLAAVLGGLALLTLASMERYGRVRLTRDALRVGRDTVPLADVDPRALLLQAAQVPALAARWPQAAQVDLSDAPLTSRPSVLGGGYAAPVGSRSLLLLTRDGRYRTLATRDPDALLEALLQAIVR